MQVVLCRLFEVTSHWPKFGSRRAEDDDN